jgi:hypothetical protein
MALTAKQRKALPASSFAYPKTRRYPIDTIARARGALSLAAKSTTSGSYAHVARAVRAKHGDKVTTTGPTKGVLHRAGTRKGGARRRK